MNQITRERKVLNVEKEEKENIEKNVHVVTQDRDGDEDIDDADIVFNQTLHMEVWLKMRMFIKFHNRSYLILNHHQNMLSVMFMIRKMNPKQKQIEKDIKH